jgi:hypothetical protein
VSSGEEFLPGDSSTLTPWWLPLSEGNSAHVPKSNSNINNVHLRDQGQYSYRALPRHLFTPFGASCSDYGFPRGWHCTNCGKLNEQIHFRHRKCSNCQVLFSVGLFGTLRLMSIKAQRSSRYRIRLDAFIGPGISPSIINTTAC